MKKTIITLVVSILINLALIVNGSLGLWDEKVLKISGTPMENSVSYTEHFGFKYFSVVDYKTWAKITQAEFDRSKSDVKIPVRIQYGAEIFDFTFDEFYSKLSKPVCEKIEKKTTTKKTK